MSARIRSTPSHRPAAPLFALLLWLLSAPVLALGLGQIQVKSKPGQPLLAEIPIVSSEPSELQGLQARLASPETFRRVGLEPPQGIVSDLQFTPAVDELGRPVIRVTSSQPVQQAELSFLLEVDWGQGRLVREYSALVDTPRSVSAPLPPPIQAPATNAPTLIERPAEPVAGAPLAQPTPTAPAQPQAPVPTSSFPTPTPAPQPAPPPANVAATPASPPPQAPSAPPEATPSELAPVRRGQTLAQIAANLPGTGGYSLDQTMIALLRANPDAFIGEDINRLRQGAVLRVPGADELARTSAAEAATLVRDQVASWRQARSAAQVAPVSTDAAAAQAPRPASRTTPATRQVADARLEIAPPRADAATRAGTQSGASAGGEGEMLRQELQQTKESLAARDAEVQELKAKVAELEQLQKQQQTLIAMKDDALAGAQQRLAANRAAPQAATTTTPAEPAPAPQDAGFAWWWLVPAVLVVAALAWWLARRRRTDVATASGPRVSDAFASTTDAVPDAVVPPPAAAAPRRSDAAPAVTPRPASKPVVPAAAPAAPVWAAKSKPTPAAAPAPVAVAAVGSAPTWVGAAPGGVETITPLNQAPGGRDRIELARAYADLGDRSTARSLLQEVMAGGDNGARDEAARLLQTLG